MMPGFLRFKIAVVSGSIGVSFALAPSQVSAFKERLQAQSTPKLQPEKNRKVIILDNDYLDRRFGKSRRGESSASDNGMLVERGAFTSGGSQIIDIQPKRSSEVSPRGSLLNGIKRGTPTRRAAALRLAETGRVLLQNGENRKAIYYLEKALGIDASPFIHFYLARAHFQLADHERALRFLEVAESGFYGDAEWQPELAAFKEALSGSPSRQATPRNIALTLRE
jgi:tetratricopeptide (TPR) repeat protein